MLATQQKHDDASENFFKQAVEHQKGIGVVKEKNLPKALEFFLLAADKGHLEAQFQAAVAYVHGWGTARDYKKAIHWLEKAAQKGHSSAQDSLGVRYATGQGVPRNDEKALHWFTKAAEQGHAVAQFNLATLYLHGQGVPQDYRHAYVWFALSGESGDPFGSESAKSVAEGLSAQELIHARQLLRAVRNTLKGGK